MENHYFDADGVYTGSAPANTGTLPPDTALRTAPPARQGYWPVLNGTRDGWELVEDHRGEEGWLDGSPATLHTLGPLPSGWQTLPPEQPGPADPAEMRKAAYHAEADPLRELAFSYKAEAEALRLAGDDDAAGRAEKKYRNQLTLYLERKNEIRLRHPKTDGGTTPDGDGEPGEEPAFYLTRSGIYHKNGCVHTRAAGEWLPLAVIRTGHPKAKPCGACRPASGTQENPPTPVPN